MKKTIIWVVVIVIIVAIAIFVGQTKKSNREYNKKIVPDTNVDLTK